MAAAKSASGDGSRKGLPVIVWVSIGAAGFAALIALLFVLVWSMTSGGADVANAFLGHVGAERYEAAYRSTAPQFQQQHSLDSFRKAMRRYGLHRHKSASWTSRQIADGRLTLTGTILTQDGQRIPATVILVKSQERWMIYALRFSGPGVNTRSVSGPGTPIQVPETAAVNQLILKALLAFDAAVQKNDFTAFHGSLARPFRAQVSPERLKKIFAEFIRKQAKIAGIRYVTPVYTMDPAIDKNGMLVVAGYYPTTPARVTFKLTFMMDDGEWRVFGIRLSVKNMQ